MYNHRGKRKKDGREYGTDFYNCSTYTLTFERETQMCFSHTVSTKALNALILETIRTTPVNRGLGGGRFFCQPPPPQNGRIGKPCGTPWRKPKPQRTAASPVNLWRRCP